MLRIFSLIAIVGKETMKNLIAIDLIILALAPILSAALVAVELATKYMPYALSGERVMRFSFSPVLMFSSIGAEALIPWILPSVFLGLMVWSLFKGWYKRNIAFAMLSTLSWVGIVQLHMIMDAMGGC